MHFHSSLKIRNSKITYSPKIVDLGDFFFQDKTVTVRTEQKHLKYNFKKIQNASY